MEKTIKLAMLNEYSIQINKLFEEYKIDNINLKDFNNNLNRLNNCLEFF